MKTLPLDVRDLVTPGGGGYWDFRAFAIPGGAARGIRFMRPETMEEALGDIDEKRLPLATAFHAYVLSLSAKGLRPSSIEKALRNICRFYKIADEHGFAVTTDSVISTFPKVMMVRRERLLAGAIKQNEYYSFVSGVAAAVADVTGDDATHLRISAGGFYDWNDGGGPKQSLADTKLQGELLVRICKELTTEVVRGDVPIKINLSDSQEFTIRCRMRLTDEELYGPVPTGSSKERPWTIKNRAKACADKSNWRRAEAINLRVEAELLIFIGQTSMNLSQAQRLGRSDISFQSHHGGYSVTAFKHRSHSDVRFEIFTSYRKHFDQYLAWLNTIVGPDVESLFPILALSGELRWEAKEYFLHVKRAASTLGIAFVSPRNLRKTRVNWLAERSGSPTLAAELAQHSEATLLAHYHRPNHQTSLVEITRFWQETDPFRMAPTHGDCAESQPTPEVGHDSLAPTPDCGSASGCLFCSNHRDAKSEDYVWSLTSLRSLKAVELSRTRSLTKRAVDQPADRVISRIDEKLRRFVAEGPPLSEWVAEAAERAREGHHHPAWAGLIALGEMI